MKRPVASHRLAHVPASPMRKLVPFANAAKKEGVHVYHLNIGDPDIKTPEEMISVLRGWKANPISYSQSQGDPEFLHALSSYYQKLGFRFVKESSIQVTTGGSEAVSMALFSVCDPGNEVIVFEPFYANYNSFAVVNGVRLVAIPTKIERGFHLPEKRVIEQHITAKTKAILVCSPNNPTGTVYTKNEMDTLVEIVKEYGLFLLSDEVYREFTYDGRKQVSLLSYMQKIPHHAIVLDSLSKRYSLCGARLGALISLNADILQGALRIAQGRLSSGSIDQRMASVLISIPPSYLRGVCKEYEKRRDVLYDGLRKIPHITIPKPEGAFYTIVGLPVADAEDFAKYLLTTFRDNNETVMVAPASGFYATPGKGRNEIRIAYVLNAKALTRSVAILKKALVSYESRK